MKPSTVIGVTVGLAFSGAVIDVKGSPDGQDHQAPPISTLSLAVGPASTNSAVMHAVLLPNDMVTGDERGAFPVSKRNLAGWRLI